MHSLGRLDTPSGPPHTSVCMRILVSHGGQQLGPFSLEELRIALGSGQISQQDLAWWEGAPSWVAVNSVPGLSIPSTPAPPAFTPPPHYQDPASGLATTSLVLGITSLIGLTCLTGIPAVICGHMAIGRQNRAGGKASGVAIAGLITGYASFALLLFMIPLIAAIAVPGFIRARERSMTNISLSNGATIIAGIESYRLEHGNRFPESLNDVENYFPNKKVLIDPFDRTKSPKGYWYSKPKDENDDQEVIVVGRGTNSAGLRMVGREDGSVDLEEYQLPAER
jgi:Domain of unknown function (DUF4190)/GYF domain 2